MIFITIRQTVVIIISIAGITTAISICVYLICIGISRAVINDILYTITVTVAESLRPNPSISVYENVSVPSNPASGV